MLLTQFLVAAVAFGAVFGVGDLDFDFSYIDVTFDGAVEPLSMADMPSVQFDSNEWVFATPVPEKWLRNRGLALERLSACLSYIGEADRGTNYEISELPPAFQYAETRVERAWGKERWHDGRRKDGNRFGGSIWAEVNQPVWQPRTPKPGRYDWVNARYTEVVQDAGGPVAEKDRNGILSLNVVGCCSKPEGHNSLRVQPLYNASLELPTADRVSELFLSTGKDAVANQGFTYHATVGAADNGFTTTVDPPRPSIDTLAYFWPNLREVLGRPQDCSDGDEGGVDCKTSNGLGRYLKRQEKYVWEASTEPVLRFMGAPQIFTSVKLAITYQDAKHADQGTTPIEGKLYYTVDVTDTILGDICYIARQSELFANRVRKCFRWD